ncbi:MAG TPA: triose-phosphate isomerase [Candidatus Fraserbacteria bacterium]|nr:triose-phosphate isomerase [Candidatus Fraserbacteria bacterium]
MRVPIVAANWKMHQTLAQAQNFVERFRPLVRGVKSTEIVLAPPFTALAATQEALRGSQIRLAAQNMHYAEQGAYTGEISPPMLCELGCEYVILGHSERRAQFGEGDALINRKLQSAYAHELISILCVGENLDQREAGETEQILARQLDTDLEGLSAEQIGRLVIAYEPIWAIGTGRTASPQDAQAGARFIRGQIAARYGGRAAQALRVQYGGSVKPGNAAVLLAQPDIDGALVGGASLDPQEFAQIVRATAT